MGAKRKKRKKRGTRINPVAVGILGILIVLCIGAAVFVIKKYGPSKERMDLAKYYNLEKEDDLAIVIDNTLIEDKGIVLDGRPYVSTQAVRKYINSRFYWDSAENLYIYTTPEEIITASVGENQYTIDKKKISVDYQILKVQDDTAYVDLEYVKNYTAMDYQYMENPNRVQIICEYGEIPAVEVKSSSQIRYRAGVKSPILTEVKRGDLLYVLEETADVGNWTKVCSQDGYIGYIQNRKLKDETTTTLTTDFVEPEYSDLVKDEVINLAWHQVTNEQANKGIYEKLANVKGINVISPTWFMIKDNDGNITSLATSDYVSYCHQNGVEVWGVVENITYHNIINITSILNKTSSRQNLVTQLIAKAIQFDLDGINVDLEALPSEAGEGFIQFIRELSILCRRNNIILSVDNYVPQAYSQNYNRREQGIVADYVIIMGYDEHFAGGEIAGSVASIDYVRNGIEQTLEEVPARKVINAVPFYTRLWKTDSEGKVRSSAIGMNEADKILRNNGVEPQWLEDCGQYYAEYINGDNFYQIWLEEERSIDEKAKLMKEYQLAGIAAWRLGYERDEIWDVILKYVN